MEVKGYLRLLILKLLDQSNGITGTEIVEKIDFTTGSKPSYGSVYPILEEFREKKFVDVEKEGRKKKYRLTKKGKEAVTKIVDNKNEFLDTLKKVLQVYYTLFGLKENELINQEIEERKKDFDKVEFPELFDVFTLILNKDLEKEKVLQVRKKLREIIEVLDEE